MSTLNIDYNEKKKTQWIETYFTVHSAIPNHAMTERQFMKTNKNSVDAIDNGKYNACVVYVRQGLFHIRVYMDPQEANPTRQPFLHLSSANNVVQSVSLSVLRMFACVIIYTSRFMPDQLEPGKPERQA